MSPTPGLGEDDDDPLLDDEEVDMRAVMVAGGVMEFELLRQPPQSKTVGPAGLGPSSKVGGSRGRGGAGLGVSSLLHNISHIAKYVCVYAHNVCKLH